jgi:hypothetical protein
MRLLGPLVISALVAVLATFGGCHQKSNYRYEVGGRTFQLPAQFLIVGGPFWLQRGEADAPQLVLNPGARVQDHISALLQTASDVCNGVTAEKAGDYTALCRGGGGAERLLTTEEIRSARKVPDRYNVTRGYSTQARPDALQRLIAVCTPVSTAPGNDLCRHIYRDGDIMITIGLSEQQLTALPTIRKNLEQALKEWELPS